MTPTRPKFKKTLLELSDEYKSPPGQLVDFNPPSVSDVMDALDGVTKARRLISGYSVTIETSLGDVILVDNGSPAPLPEISTPVQEIRNAGIEFFKVKAPDMLGSSQWSVQRNNRTVKVEMLHKGWLDAYHRREKVLQPGDSLKCKFEERILYDGMGTEIERKLAVIEVLEILSPPVQQPLL